MENKDLAHLCPLFYTSPPPILQTQVKLQFLVKSIFGLHDFVNIIQNWT